MVKELFVIGDVSRLVIKGVVEQLKTTGCEIKVLDLEKDDTLSSLPSTPIHLVVCLYWGMNPHILWQVSELQKTNPIHLYLVGTQGNVTLEEEHFLNKLASTRFPSYSLDIEQFMNIMEKNDRQKKRILVVDDEPILLRNIKAWLGDDFDVSLVNSGEAALQFLDLHPIDLMLLDYNMPVMDGPEVFKKIRADERLWNLPVIFLTAKNDRESVMSVMNLKPAGYILKSKTPDEIKNAVKDFFKNRIVRV